MYFKARKTRSPKYWKRFKEYRQKAKNEIRSSHKTYLQNIIGESIKDNPKPFWSYIKSLWNDTNEIPTLKSPSGIPAASDKSKANTLVNQFSSLFTKENLDTLPQLDNEYPDMPNIEFGQEGILKLLRDTNPNMGPWAN